MPKKRTRNTTGASVARPETKKGTKYSTYLLTVNPLRTFISRSKSPGWDEMNQRLEALGDFLLKKSTIKLLLDFGKEGNRELNGVILEREEHINLIDDFDPERVASVEYGEHNKTLHLHVSFALQHRTFLRINPQRLDLICSRFLGMPKKPDGRYPFHTDIKVSGRDIKAYVRKGFTE